MSAKRVRHHESLGLLAKVGRGKAGCRQYGEQDLHALRFIRRARELSFGMAEMAAMKRTLEQLARCCRGDGRPDCLILVGLAV